MNNVFVWVKFGNATVYRTESYDDCVYMLEELRNIIIDLDRYNCIFNKIDAYLNKSPHTSKYVRIAINYIVDEFVVGGDSDIFDYGSGFSTLTVFTNP